VANLATLPETAGLKVEELLILDKAKVMVAKILSTTKLVARREMESMGSRRESTTWKSQDRLNKNLNLRRMQLGFLA